MKETFPAVEFEVNAFLYMNKRFYGNHAHSLELLDL